jgi:hypothetical protein
MQLGFSLEQGRRRGLFFLLRGYTIYTGLYNDLFSSLHDWGRLYRGGEVGKWGEVRGV